MGHKYNLANLPLDTLFEMACLVINPKSTYYRTSLIEINWAQGGLDYDIVWITELIVLFTNLTAKTWL